MKIVSTVFCDYYNQILSWFFNMVHLHFLQTLLSSFWNPVNGSAVCFHFHSPSFFSSAVLFFSSIIPRLYPGQEKSAIRRSSAWCPWFITRVRPDGKDAHISHLWFGCSHHFTLNMIMSNFLWLRRKFKGKPNACVRTSCSDPQWNWF